MGARLALLSDGPIMPGEHARVQLVLDRPIAAAAGDPFVLRDTSAQRTIGGGRFIDLRAPARKRRTVERMAQLDALAIDDPARALAALLDCAPGYVDLMGFARDRARGEDEIERIVKELRLIRLPGQSRVFAMSTTRWLRLERGIFERLTAFHAENPDLPGIGAELLRRQIELRLPASVFAAAVQALARDKEVTLHGAWVQLPNHKARLTADEEALWHIVRPLLAGNERFRPPRVRDISAMIGRPERDIRGLCKLLCRLGEIYEVAPDHYFLCTTVAEMVEIAGDIASKAPDGQFAAAAFRDRLDNGRKVAIQILEFFDRHGVTLRRGDLRRVNDRRLESFRRPADEQPPSAISGREASPVGRPDFKSGRGRQPVFGGFDSHSLPPKSRTAK